MIIINNNLLKKDNENKVQYVKLFFNKHVDVISGEPFYSITGRIGNNKNKMKARPLVLIDQCKTKQTLFEQAKYQYNLLLNSYKNKGYIEIVDSKDIINAKDENYKEDL